MTERCADLDEFFDGELATDQADVFREHLASCERCQDVLHGRMQESVAARVPAARLLQAAAPPAAAARVAAPELVAPASAAAARAMAPGSPARPWGCGRVLAYAAPILAAAAAVPLWLAHQPTPGFQLSLAIDRAPVTERGAEVAVPRRGLAAHTGDVLRPKVQRELHLAIWVYLDERELILRCPEDATCRSADGELTVELKLTARGTYAVVAAGSSGDIPTPAATLDRTLAAARTAGVRTQVEYVAVD